MSPRRNRNSRGAGTFRTGGFGRPAGGRRADTAGRADGVSRLEGARRVVGATRSPRMGGDEGPTENPGGGRAVQHDTLTGLHDTFPTFEIRDCPLPKASNVIPKISARVRNFKQDKLGTQVPKHCKDKIMDLNKHEGMINSVLLNETSRITKKLALWNQRAAAVGWKLSDANPPGVNARVFNRFRHAEIKKIFKKIGEQNLKIQKHLTALEKEIANKAESM